MKWRSPTIQDATMATAQHIQNETDLVALKFSPWLMVHRNTGNSDALMAMLHRTTNIDVMYTSEKGEVIATNTDVKHHARATDIEACIQKGLKLMFGKDEVKLVTQTLQSGIPTIRLIYDDRRRGLTGGMNWMMTSDYTPHLTEHEKKHYTKKYTLTINIRERAWECCDEDACGEWAISNKFHKCSQCEEVVYCSKECQQKQWKKHKAACLASPLATNTKTARIHDVSE